MQHLLEPDDEHTYSGRTEKDSRRQDARPEDWHFELLAEFEEMMKLYEQDHIVER